MNKLIAYFIFVFFIVALFGAAFANAPNEDPEGKKLFLSNKCNTCHAIQSQGITTNSKKQNPDLSDIGTKYKADFLKNYLMKKEKINTKTHPALYKGTEKDLDVLVKWLESFPKGK
ncbi:MAG: hypothetical protein STSR0008_19690 [Ignavibacterium sp.]